ncbi:MAG: RNA polymerase sigma factor [Xanthomonadales bacterium]|nr:RNA polymerase sigma factor [Gammaproteobacteria bacterium]MBT8053695.1 RNA polymerase sigma factor [Gammaproteobacteria bacterium]NND57050.1 RNA polymerase sigma factor [Xanthomonadales bacterium]NNK51868.1 RNA polymerase sigma factor [Xanthomonadales bacterium]
MPIYLEDRKLVKQLVAGKEQAFNQFFVENFARLYRFILPRVSHDEEAAKEVVQASLSRALEKIHGFRGESALFTWLCVIARNEMVDGVRRNARYRKHIVLTEDYPEIQAAVESILAPPTDDPHKHYQKYEMSRLIHVALDRLPPKYGDALEWKYIQGYSVKEIAARMELSPEAAQSLLARAKRAFQDIYSSLARPVIEEAIS